MRVLIALIVFIALACGTGIILFDITPEKIGARLNQVFNSSTTTSNTTPPSTNSGNSGSSNWAGHPNRSMDSFSQESLNPSTTVSSSTKSKAHNFCMQVLPSCETGSRRTRICNCFVGQMTLKLLPDEWKYFEQISVTRGNFSLQGTDPGLPSFAEKLDQGIRYCRN